MKLTTCRVFFACLILLCLSGVLFFINRQTPRATYASFGFQPGVTIAGTIWNDYDGDGIKDAGEPNMTTSATVTLNYTRYDGSPASISNSFTGSYTFYISDYQPGGASVSASKASWRATNSPRNFNIPSGGGTVSGQDLGLQGSLTISGALWNDYDGDGVKDAGEPNMTSSATVTLNYNLSDGSPSSTSGDFTGSYTFTLSDYQPGNASTSVSKSGWRSTNSPRSFVLPAGGGTVSGQDLGLQNQVVIGGDIWNDYDGDGVKDAGEPNMTSFSQVSLNYTLANGTPTSTFGLFIGSYSFTISDYQPGNASVSVSKGGWRATNSPRNISIPNGGGAVLGQDLGLQNGVTISGDIFNDYDGDGTRDAGEPDMTSSATVSLSYTRSDGSPASISNLFTGSYSFTLTDYRPGNASTSATKAGWRSTNSPRNFSLPSGGGTVSGQDLGLQNGVTISGDIFNDLDGDGVKDAGESNMTSLATVSLSYTRSDGSSGSSSGSFTGSYAFTLTDYQPGSASTSVSKSGWGATNSPRNFNLPAGGGTVSGQDLGLRENTLTVNGALWNDYDGDGVKDGGEPNMVSSATVTLNYNRADGSPTSTSGVFTGSYTFTLTDYQAGNASSSASKANWRSTNSPRSFVLPAGGGTVSGQDLGLQNQVVISGDIFNDYDGDGVKDAGEPLMSSSATVTLNYILSNGTPTSTNGGFTGSYSFTISDYQPGNASVSVSKGGWRATNSPRNFSIPNGGGAVLGQDLGLQNGVTISGDIFNDYDGDGSRDAGEPLMGSSATVSLSYTRSDGSPASISNLFTGSYSFTLTDYRPINASTSASKASWRATNSPRNFSLPNGGGTVSEQDLGLQNGVTISGDIFNDLDGDGVKDAGESNMTSSATVSLSYTRSDGSSGSSSGSFTGSYAFSLTDYQPGSAATSVSKSGWGATNSPRSFNLPAGGGTVSGQDLGLWQIQVTISGDIFNDLDGDGVKDGGETNMTSSATVTLNYSRSDGSPASISGDFTGSYTFTLTDYQAGNASTSVAKSGWGATNSPRSFVLPAGGGTVSGQDLGLRESTLTINGDLWNDYDGDGIKDAGEPLMTSSATVTLNYNRADGSPTSTSGVFTGSYTFTLTDYQAGNASTSVSKSGWRSTNSPRSFVLPAGGGTVSGQDLGLQNQVVISGDIFNDYDGDGVKDAGEPLMSSSATVTLNYILSNGTPTSTNGGFTGSYSFTISDYQPGNASVSVSKGGWRATNSPRNFSIPNGGGAVLGQDLGLQNGVTISGDIFNDYDGDGSRDAGEPLMGSSATVSLSYTRSDGSPASISNLFTGSYSFNLTDYRPINASTSATKASWRSTNSPRNFSLPNGGGTVSGQDLGLQNGVTISGDIFNDLDGDGVKDAGELNMTSSATVSLNYTRSDGSSGSSSGSFTGSYAFSLTDYQPGSASTSVSKSGWGATNSPRNFNLPAGGGTVSGQDLGLRESSVTITGDIWNDYDGDGVKDAGEPNMTSSATVTLNYNRADGSPTSTSGVFTGSYTFTLTDYQAGNASTSVSKSGWRATNSPRSFVLPAGGGTVSGQDLGLQNQVVISGDIFNDYDGDGVKDAGEPNMTSFSQVSLNYTLANGTPTSTFGLFVGSYTFTVSDYQPGNASTSVSKGGWRPTNSPRNFSLPAGGGTISGQDLGLQNGVTVSGDLWNDYDGDGVKDAGEPLMTSSATVTLNYTLANGTPASVSGSFTGSYTFTLTDYRPGNGTASVSKAGWRSTNSPRSFSLPNGGGVVSGQDLGLQNGVTVSGDLWNDLDGDGIRDGGEPLMSSSATVTLNYTLANGTPSSVSGSFTGSYTFTLTDYRPGNGTATASKVSWRSTNSPRSFSLPNGGGLVSGQDLGLQSGVTISGDIWNDYDGDGVKDAGEPNMTSSATVTLNYNRSDGSPASTSGNFTGSYIFTLADYQAGNASTSASKSGWRTTNSPRSFLLPAGGGTVSGQDLGLQNGVTISGALFNDYDGDGVKDVGEPNMVSSATVVLNYILSNGSPTSSSGNFTGSYTFLITDYQPGNASASASKSGWRATNSPRNFTLPAGGGTLSNRDLGLQNSLVVSGDLWNDLDGDGVKDAGEPLISSAATVTLNYNLSSGAATSISGSFTGSYNFTLTDYQPGGATATASKANWRSTNSPKGFTLPAGGGTVSGIDLGLQNGVTVSGDIWNDYDGDGVKDAGEPNVSSAATVTLNYTLSNGSATSSSGNFTGSYTFIIVDYRPGSGSASVSKSGWRATNSPRSFTLPAGGGTVSVDLGLQSGVTVSGDIWNDYDGEGIKDPGEPNLDSSARVTLAYSLADGSPADATSDFIGSYSFTLFDYTPGPGSVSVEKTGWRATNSPWGVSLPIGGGTVSGQDLGLQNGVLILGNIWNDYDGDGIWDAGEVNMTSSATVTLTYTKSDGSVSALSNAFIGIYSFYLLDYQPGAAAASASASKSGWRATNSPLSIDIPYGGGLVANQNLGLQQYGSVFIRVFIDDGLGGTAEDGIKDSLEVLSGDGYSLGKLKKLDNTEVALFSGASATLTNVIPDFYKVEITLVENWRVSRWSLDAAGDPVFYDPHEYVCSGSTCNTGVAFPVEVIPGGQTGADLGQRQLGIIQGRVFLDADGDGAYEPSEGESLATSSDISPKFEAVYTSTHPSAGTANVAGANIGDGCGGGYISYRAVDLTPTSPGGYQYTFVFDFSAPEYYVTDFYYTTGTGFGCQSTPISPDPHGGSSGSGDVRYTVSNIQLAAGQIVNLWLGVRKTGKIEGYLWDDMAWDGTTLNRFFDDTNGNVNCSNVSGDECRLRDAAFALRLVRGMSAVAGPLSPGNNGTYEFTNLVPGEYKIYLRPKANWCDGRGSRGQTGWNDATSAFPYNDFDGVDYQTSSFIVTSGNTLTVNLGITTDFTMFPVPVGPRRVNPGSSTTYAINVIPDPSDFPTAAGCWGGGDATLSLVPYDNWGSSGVDIAYDWDASRPGNQKTVSINPNASEAVLTIKPDVSTPEGEYFFTIFGDSTDPRRQRILVLSVIVKRRPWLQISNGDLYVGFVPPEPTTPGIDFLLPEVTFGGYERFFLRDTRDSDGVSSANDIRGGVVVDHSENATVGAVRAVDPSVSDCPTNCPDVTSERLWHALNHPVRQKFIRLNATALERAATNISTPWPVLTPGEIYKYTENPLPPTYDLSGPGVALVYVDRDVTIDPTLGTFRQVANDPSERVVLVINGNFTIPSSAGKHEATASDRAIIEAIIIIEGEEPKGYFILEDIVAGDPEPNKVVKIEGDVFARNGYDFRRDLEENRYPFLVIDYSPRYFLEDVPFLKTSIFSWSEIKP